VGVVKSRAAVLAKHDFSETSQIVALLTPEVGMIRGLAKGARRLKANFEGGFDLFDTVDVVFVDRPQGLAAITESRLVTRRTDLGRRRPCFMAASVARELILRATAEHEPDRALCQALGSLFDALAAFPDVKAPLALLAFEFAFLESQGLAPDWARCVLCGVSVARRGLLDYNAREGGLTCPKCAPKSEWSTKVRAGAIALALKLQQESFAALPRLGASRPLIGELQEIVKLVLAYASLIVPRSLKYVWN